MKSGDKKTADGWRGFDLSPYPSPQPSLRGGATAWRGKGRGFRTKNFY
jgi:hypothetical protein